MLKLFEQDRKQALPRRCTQSTGLAGKTNVSSPQSCLSDGSVVSRHSSHGSIAETDRFGGSLAGRGKHVAMEEDLPCQTSNSTSSSVVEDGEGVSQPRTAESDQNPTFNNIHSKIDTDRIREALRRRKRGDEAANKKLVEVIDPVMDSEAWIERELENGIELESASSRKKRIKYCEVLTH